MVKVPEKLMKQLKELIEGQHVLTYTRNPGDYIRINNYLSEIYIDGTKSVSIYSRAMVVLDLFTPPEEYKELKRLFGLEKKEQEYDKLKISIDTLKGHLK